MTRLLILTALAVLSTALAGCNCCSWCGGGGCAPCGDACAPGDPYLSAPVVTPGAEVYAPGPA
jgi:hypothetical protein